MTEKRKKEFYTLKDLNYKDKIVLLRTDYNTPLNDDGTISDNSRIKASLKTIRFLLKKEAKIVIISHLGRPKGAAADSLRMDRIAAELSRLLGKDVYKLDDIYGGDVKEFLKDMRTGEITILENIRFCPGEERGSYELAKKVSSLGEIYINDAFSVCHRNHSSISKIPLFIPGAAGYLFEEEIKNLRLLSKPKQPFIWILGGAKIKDKSSAIYHLGKDADKILIGGKTALSFLAVEGILSRSEEKKDKAVKDIYNRYRDKIILPADLVQTDDIDYPKKVENNNIEDINADMYSPDIGKKTIQMFKDEIKSAKTILWTGPLGVIESRLFCAGSVKLARFISKLDAVKIIGGGDTDAVLDSLSLTDKMTYVSRSGGAMLHYLGGEKLPGIEALKKSFEKF